MGTKSKLQKLLKTGSDVDLRTPVIWVVDSMGVYWAPLVDGKIKPKQRKAWLWLTRKSILGSRRFKKK